MEQKENLALNKQALEFLQERLQIESELKSKVDDTLKYSSVHRYVQEGEPIKPYPKTKKFLNEEDEQEFIKTRKELSKTKATQYNAINRNDLCPCGRGKKYKKCCEESYEV
jgi:uncharacterized protein YecA (UPF0149 family)